MGRGRSGEENNLQVISKFGQTEEFFDNIDEYAQEEVDELEDTISAAITTAETIEQLEEEVKTLRRLEAQALGVLRSGHDANGLN